MKFINNPKNGIADENPLCCDHNNDCNSCTDTICPQPDAVCPCNAICIGCIIGGD